MPTIASSSEEVGIIIAGCLSQAGAHAADWCVHLLVLPSTSPSDAVLCGLMRPMQVSGQSLEITHCWAEDTQSTVRSCTNASPPIVLTCGVGFLL